MTRVNWFMSMQSMPLVPLIAFYAFVATADNYFKYDPILVTWGVVSVTYIAAIIYCVALQEVYNHLLYIEADLKKKIAVLLDLRIDSFWGWERYLRQGAKHPNHAFQVGKPWSQVFVDLVPTAIALAPFTWATATALQRIVNSAVGTVDWHSWLWDLVGIGIGGLLTLFAVALTARVVKARKVLEAALRTGAMDSPKANGSRDERC
jgi:hypothetical protein